MSKGFNKDVWGVRGSRGGVKVSQEVKTSVRGVPWVKGGLRDPRGLRWTSWVYQGFQGAPRRCPRGSRGTLVVSKGINKDVRGVRGSRGTPRGVSGALSYPRGQEGCPRGRGKSRGSKGVKRDVWGVPGAQGSTRDI